VIGIAEAAMHTATLLATRFSIVTTLPRTLTIARHLLHQYGFERHCAALHAIDLPVLALEDGSGLAQQKVREQCLQSLRQDGCGAIVLGCGGMASLARQLTQELGIPVIDGVSAAVKMIESLHALGLNTAKCGDLAYPLAKPLSGVFSGLNA
jgi:allantoin racemase